MNRITKKFAELKQKNKKALIPYIAAGDPSADLTLKIMRLLVANGADILEIGIPFSDPVADGIEIQAAHQRALAGGMNLQKVMQLVTEFRKNDKATPIILMGYINPIATLGYEKFVTELQQAEVDGLLLVDLPPEEGIELTSLLKAKSIEPIFLIAPTTTDARLTIIAEAGAGFLYVVSLKGVTGSTELNISAVEQQLARIRKVTSLPLAVGFGIRNGKTAAAIAQFAEAIVVGSAYVSMIKEQADNPTLLVSKLCEFTSELRAAIDLKD